MSPDSPREPERERRGNAPDSGPISPAPPKERGRHTTSISGFLISPRWASPSWLLLLLLALAEVLALWVRKERVPDTADYVSAAAVVRRAWKPKDAVTIAPGWADPLLRLHLGDVMSLEMAGRFDLAGFERLWVVSIRGARPPEAPPRNADFHAEFGAVTLERYDFGPSPVVADLVALFPQASVEQEARGSFTPCTYRELPRANVGGGLSLGPAVPRKRFVCDARGGSAWVGLTMFEDLSLAPRYCIYQAPTGRDAVVTTFRDVPLGEELVVYAALDYHAERDETGAPVSMRVLVDGREVGTLVHRDGEGTTRLALPTRGIAGQPVARRGELRFEVTSENPARRVFCWAASVRDAHRKETP